MFPVITAFVLIVGGGAVHGLLTDRWQLSDEPEASAAKLTQIPLALEDWQGEDLEQKNGKVGGVAGTLQRRYVNRHDGRTVTVFIVCGRPGPVSVHVPTDCYVAAGYEMLSTIQCSGPANGAEPPGKFWSAQFRKVQAADQTYLRIFWAWNAEGQWQAPEDPRFTFARHPALFKMYLLRDMPAPDDNVDGDPCLDLLKQLEPAMQTALFTKS
jgi:hypothetical protein